MKRRKYPARIGRFEIIQPVGQGAHGSVFKARDPQLGRFVALKVIRMSPLATDDDDTRFYREARAAATLEHPGIAPVFEAGNDGGRCYIAAAFVDGDTLEQRIRSRTRFDLDTTVAIVEKLAVALDYSHQQGVVHRDVKPGNVMLDTDNRPKIVDFGLARLAAEASLTMDGARMGTPSYMSPEQHSGKSRDADARSDLWGLGVVFYELLTGSRPFQGDNDLQLSYAVQMTQPPLPSEIRADVPGDIDEICMKCLEKVPDERYQTCGELADDLARWRRREVVRARPVGPLEYLALWCRRNVARTVMLATILLLLAIIGVLLLSGESDTDRIVDLDNRSTPTVASEAVPSGTQISSESIPFEKAPTEPVPTEQTPTFPVPPVPIKRAPRSTASPKTKTTKPPTSFRAGTANYQLVSMLGDARLKHWSSVASVAFSPDGNDVVSGSSDHTARVWNAADGRLVHVLLGHTDDIRGVAFSRDGKTLATASRDTTIKCWDTASWREKGTLIGHSGSVSAVAFNNDGRQLLSGGLDDSVMLWNTVTHELVKSLGRHDDDILSAAFGPRGRLMATGDNANFLKIWRADGKNALHTLKEHTDHIHAVAFSPDGRYVASAACNRDRRIIIWNMSTGQKHAELKGHTRGILCIRYSGNGKWIYSGGYDNTVRRWDVKTGTGRQMIDAGAYVRGLAETAGGEMLAVAANLGEVQLWNVTRRRRQSPAADGHANAIASLAFVPGRESLVSAGWDGAIYQISLADSATWRKIGDHGAPILSAAISPDGKQFSVGGDDGRVTVWDLRNGRRISDVKGHDGSVQALCYRPNSNTLISGGFHGDIKVWFSSSTGTVQHPTGRSLFAGHRDDILSLAFTGDGETLASASQDGTVKLWDADTGQLKVNLTGHTSSVTCAAFNDDGNLLATGSSDRTIRVWDIAARTSIRSLRGHQESIQSVAFSPDGEILASTAADGTLRLWKPSTGERGQTIGIGPPGGLIKEAIFDATGRMIATANGNGTIAVFKAKAGVE